MRPVDKGTAPTVYADYRHAGPDLKSRIGNYCSYCERQIATNLAVEHIRPKAVTPHIRTLGKTSSLLVATAIRVKGAKM